MTAKSFTYKVDVPEGRSGDWAVERFTVSRDVIILVGPWLTKIAAQQHKPLTIVEADITTWSPPNGTVYDLAWFDIWDEINGDNLPEMRALHRRFARKAKWKGSWGRDWIERERRAEQRNTRMWG